MKALFINGNRDGYSPEQCRRTLTVGELIDVLREYDPERPVYLINDNGYTYGSIQECGINQSEEFEDSDKEENEDE
jgi:hypothetical protein